MLTVVGWAVVIVAVLVILLVVGFAGYLLGRGR